MKEEGEKNFRIRNINKQARELWSGFKALFFLVTILGILLLCFIFGSIIFNHFNKVESFIMIIILVLAGNGILLYLDHRQYRDSIYKSSFQQMEDWFNGLLS